MCSRYFVLPFTIAALHSPAFAKATSGTGALPLPLVLNILINAATLYLFVARCVPYGVVFYVEIC